MSFKFELDDEVVITLSGTEATITARAEYTNGVPNYYQVDYVNSLGDPVSMWVLEANIEELA